jgi:hypothetical protein
VNSSSQAFSGLPSWRCSWVQKPPRSASTAIALGQPGCARNRGTVLAFRSGMTWRGGRPAEARSAAPPATGCASAAAAPSPAPMPSPAARNCLLSMILSDPTQRRCFSYQLTFGLRQAAHASSNIRSQRSNLRNGPLVTRGDFYVACVASQACAPANIFLSFWACSISCFQFDAGRAKT